MRKIKVLIMLLVLTFLVNGCVKQSQKMIEEKPLSIPNPAAVYCANQGYEYEDGFCIFLDNSRCGQWDFFRGKCGQKFTFCEQQGFKIENRVDDMESWTSEYAVCVFDKISECLEQDYFEKKCRRFECEKWEMSKGGCVKPQPVPGCIPKGSTFSQNGEDKCCVGSYAKWNYYFREDNNCNPPLDKICIKCPDGICGIGENGCNCPEDCNGFKCNKHGEVPHYPGPGGNSSLHCCGLTFRQMKDTFDKDCNSLLSKGGTSGGGYYWICLACGDGTCDSEYESKCNCPEDCK